jgi:hypothetical protein
MNLKSSKKLSISKTTCDASLFLKFFKLVSFKIDEKIRLSAKVFKIRDKNS